jgi:hypothetical protein
MTPDGKPETLYDLCDLVCESIATSPANYFQGRWAIPVRNISKPNSTGCGTAFCRAGWMVAHLRPAGRMPTQELSLGMISETAVGLLTKAGVPPEDIADLFSGSALYNLSYDTPEYAEEGIAGMQRFMAKHSDKLKAARVQMED